LSIRSWILGRFPERVTTLEGQTDSLGDEVETLRSVWMEKERTYEAQLARFEALTEEIDERIDRGNKIWRAIRARERRQEVLEDFDDPQQLHLLDGEGGEGEGVPPMHPDLAAPGTSLPPHKEIARQIAGQIIGSKQA